MGWLLDRACPVGASNHGQRLAVAGGWHGAVGAVFAGFGGNGNGNPPPDRGAIAQAPIKGRFPISGRSGIVCASPALGKPFKIEQLRPRDHTPKSELIALKLRCALH
jgi:hypothetical protein